MQTEECRGSFYIYCGIIRPGLEYATPAWSPYLQHDIAVLERVQRRATKFVTGLYNVPYEDRLRFLGLQTLQTRRHRADLILTYQLLHHLVDYDWSNLFTMARTSGLRGHPLKLAVNHGRLDCRRKSFAFRVVNSWNSLPSTVVMAPSTPAFKRRLHDSGGAQRVIAVALLFAFSISVHIKVGSS